MKLEFVPDGRLRVDNLDLMRAKERRRFNWLRIDANNNCNLNCTYCRVPRSNSIIDANDLRDFLETKVDSVVNLQFGCGMEPTLDPRLPDLMLMSAKTPAKPSGQFVVQTNGTLLNHLDHEKMRLAGLSRLSVSIDSLDPKVHETVRGGSSIDQIIRNIRDFRKNCPRVELQFICVVTQANLDSGIELAKFALDLGVKRLAYRQVVYHPNHPNTNNDEMENLVVSRDRFNQFKTEIENEIGEDLQLSFYTTEDLADHRQTMRKDSYLIKSADKPFLTPLKDYKDEEDLLADKNFFVVRGFMKSGTNWLGRLLNLHPAISCAGEFHWQTIAAPFIKLLDESKLIDAKKGLRHQMWTRLDRMMKECMVLANHPDATWIGDRTPTQIEPSLIQNSKIINLIRDGRDVLISRTYHFFNNPKLFPKYSEMPENQARLRAFRKDSQFFIKNPGELLACREFVNESGYFWSEFVNRDRAKLANVEQERKLIVRYEDLHADIESERRRIYDFFGVKPDLAEPLTFNTHPGFEKEMPNRFLRKGCVGDWKNYMTAEAVSVFNEHAGEALLELGYVDDLNWNNPKPINS